MSQRIAPPQPNDRPRRESASPGKETPPRHSAHEARRQRIERIREELARGEYDEEGKLDAAMEKLAAALGIPLRDEKD